ncbi:MAG: hypothetical protein LBQ52_07710 [Helicobacteraceae bacterium]|nr:hypothetical protein [Helicobacteraceae bacterium]
MFFLEWIYVTIVILAIGFLFFKAFYYKNLLEKEHKSNQILKETLKEAEIFIRKYQLQLQRSLGNTDILNEEMNRLRNDVKAFKARNAQYRIENERIRHKIKDLESKIEALL